MNNQSAADIKQGIFSVNDAGQSNYEIPIFVPPGISCMQPKLSLIYNSSVENGVCGVGWSLSGISTITRVPANILNDGYQGTIEYDNSDRLCLDGQRLINITGQYWGSNSVYYLQNHDWRKVVGGKKPQDGFIVYCKNGQIWRYGTNTNSAIKTYNNNAIRVWALDSIEDLNGNKIEFIYTNIPVKGAIDTGQYYLTKIQYTINNGIAPRFFVNFSYKHRPDEMITYIAGNMVKTSFLLSEIEMMVDTNKVCSYELCYGIGKATTRSRLEQVIISGADGTTLNPVLIDWQDTAVLNFNSNSPTSILLNTNGVIETIPADVNGDGITEIVQFYLDAYNNINIQTYLPSETGGLISYQSSASQSLAYYSTYKIFMADVNGDGVADIIILYPGGSNNLYLCIDTYIGNGNGYASPLTLVSNNLWHGSKSIGFFPIDVNGDGRIDIVEAYYDSTNNLNFDIYISNFIQNTGSISFSTSVNTNTNYSQYATPYLWPIDVNGDGLVDMVIQWQDFSGAAHVTSYITSSNSNGINYFNTNVSSDLNTISNYQLSIFPADVNGDGIVDIIQVNEYNGTFILQSFFSDTTGKFIPGPSSKFHNQVFKANQLIPAGVNGGSQTSIIAVWLDSNSFFNYCVFSSSTSGVFTQSNSIQTNIVLTNPLFFIGDANGNGKADLYYYFINSNNQYAINPLISQGLYPDLVNCITDAIGKQINISYSPLTDSSVYSHNSYKFPQINSVIQPSSLCPSQYPIQKIIGAPIYVTASYTVTNNNFINRFGIQKNYEFSYANAFVNSKGIGWEGFQTVKKKNLNTGLTIVKTFLQDYPFTGALISKEIMVSNAISKDLRIQSKLGYTLMRLTLYNYDVTYFPTASILGSAHQINKMGVLKYTYNYGESNFDQLIAETYTYDNYGNILINTNWGYIAYIDPATIVSTSKLPILVPLNIIPVLYKQYLYLNDILPSGSWVLGYPLIKKTTINQSLNNINSFNTGDYYLKQFTYTTGTYKVATESIWDNSCKKMQISSYQYDRFGNIVLSTLPGGLQEQVTIDDIYNIYPIEKIITYGNPLLTIYESLGFDPRFGKQIFHIDLNGLISIQVLDGFGRLIAIQGSPPAGCSETDTNLCSNIFVGKNTIQNSPVITFKKTSYLSENNGRIFIKTEVLQEFPINKNRKFSEQLSYINIYQKKTLEALNTFTPNGYSVKLFQYNCNGKLISESASFFCNDLLNPTALTYTTYEYDVLSRHVLITQLSGINNNIVVKNTFYYDAGGLIHISEANGSNSVYTQLITSCIINGSVRYIKVEVPQDNIAVSLFNYDAVGRLIESIDPQGIINTITYDSLNRKVTYDNTDQNNSKVIGSNALVYTYNPNNTKVESITDVGGNQTNFVYDELGRITNELFSDGRNIKYEYDKGSNALGRLSAAKVYDNTGNLESENKYGYDKYGNVVTKLIVVNEESFLFQYVYDPLKKVISISYPDNSILTKTYWYGMLVRQTLDGVSISYPDNLHTPSCQATTVNYNYNSNSILVAEYQYNNISQIYNEKLKTATGNILLNFDFTYDEHFNLTSVIERIHSVDEHFTYANKRLTNTNINLTGQQTLSYSYDNAGRIESKDGNIYTYTNSHFPDSIRGTNSPNVLRDITGKIVSRTLGGVTQTFEYDVKGNLTNLRSTNLSNSKKIIYDWKNRKVAEVYTKGMVVYFLDDNYQLITNKTSKPILKKFLSDSLGRVAVIVNTSGQTESFFFRRNKKGNTTHIYSQAGIMVSQYAFDGYGKPINVNMTSTIPALTGFVLYENKEYDLENELYYFNARYYDPILGLFLTPDNRLCANKIVSGSWNRYAMELNNPVNCIDPSGNLNIWEKIGLITAIVGITIGAIVLTAIGAPEADEAAQAGDEALGTILADSGSESSSSGSEVCNESAEDAAADTNEGASDENSSSNNFSKTQRFAANLSRVTRTLARTLPGRIAQNTAIGTFNGVGSGFLNYTVKNWNNEFNGKDLLNDIGKDALAGALSGLALSAGSELVGASQITSRCSFVIKFFGRITLMPLSQTLSESTADLIIDHQWPSGKEFGLIWGKNILSFGLGNLLGKAVGNLYGVAASNITVRLSEDVNIANGIIPKVQDIVNEISSSAPSVYEMTIVSSIHNGVG